MTILIPVLHISFFIFTDLSIVVTQVSITETMLLAGNRQRSFLEMNRGSVPDLDAEVP